MCDYFKQIFYRLKSFKISLFDFIKRRIDNNMIFVKIRLEEKGFSK